MPGLLDNPQAMALMALGSGLLRSSGPSRMPVGMGQALGMGGQDMMQAYQLAQQGQMTKSLQQAQLQQIEDKRKADAQRRLAQQRMGNALNPEFRQGMNMGEMTRPELGGLLADTGNFSGMGGLMFPKQDYSQYRTVGSELVNLGASGGPQAIPGIGGPTPTTRARDLSSAGYSPGTPKYQNRMNELLGAANKPSASRYQNLGAYVDSSGRLLGEGRLDKQAGKYEMKRSGRWGPMPEGAIPRTESGLLKGAMTGDQFYKLASEVQEDERSLRQLDRYMKNVDSTEQGWKLLVDKLHGHFQTIFDGELTPTEFRTLIQTGQLQGLLGLFRKEVVGGGVMTEQDAFRVLSALGGDTSILRNPEVAIKLLKDIMGEKARKYNNSLRQYNFQIGVIPRGSYKRKDPIDIANMLGASSVSVPEFNPNLPAGFELD